MSAASNATLLLQACESQLANITALYNTTQQAPSNLSTSGSGAGSDPCGGSVTDYTHSIHIVAVFAVLIGSALGCLVPIVSAHVSFLRVSPYIIILGKCVGTGVVLACALVHMLQPGNQSLTSPCLPWEFNTDYNAYAFLYALLAGLLLQFIDFLFLEEVDRVNRRRREERQLELLELSRQKAQPAHVDSCEKSSVVVSAAGDEDLVKEKSSISLIEEGIDENRSGHGHSHEVTLGHSHGVELDPAILKTVEAYLLEFGVTVHSVFIGLAVGVTDDTHLRILLVALIFHQFFEGVALGARIVDAKLPVWQELILSTIFTIAAPLGIASGIAVVSTLNPNGELFLMVQGTFDSWCGGILLYIGFILLIVDFPRDMGTHCRGKQNEGYLKAGMFVALWLGAGLMAFIGKYL